MDVNNAINKILGNDNNICDWCGSGGRLRKYKGRFKFNQTLCDDCYDSAKE